MCIKKEVDCIMRKNAINFAIFSVLITKQSNLLAINLYKTVAMVVPLLSNIRTFAMCPIFANIHHDK